MTNFKYKIRVDNEFLSVQWSTCPLLTYFRYIWLTPPGPLLGLVNWRSGIDKQKKDKTPMRGNKRLKVAVKLTQPSKSETTRRGGWKPALEKLGQKYRHGQAGCKRISRKLAKMSSSRIFKTFAPLPPKFACKRCQITKIDLFVYRLEIEAVYPLYKRIWDIQ